MYTMAKPSKNMNISATEMNRMIHEQQVEAHEDEKKRKELQEASIQKQIDESNNYWLDYEQAPLNRGAKKREFLTNVKNSLLSECLFKLYKDSSVSPLTESDKVIARNLVNKFILEQGASELIREFSTKNLLLSEFSRITTKYYNRILEECDDVNDPEKAGKAREFTVEDDTKDDFFDELQDIDTSNASKLIKERVSDAIADFTDSNAEQKLEYEDIIKSAQDKMATTTDEATIEQYNNQAKRTINEMKLNRKKGIFHYMVESLAMKTFKDDNLKAKYLNEATLNMDNIVNDSMLIYNMLEMVNTTNMVNVTEEYMNEYVKSLA